MNKLLYSKLRLLASKDSTGNVWRIVIIEDGWSLNNKFYPAEVLEKRKDLFESAKIYAYEFQGKYFNHLPDEAFELINQSLSRNLAGWVDNVKFEDVGNGKALTGDLHLTDTFFKETFKSAWEAGKRDLLGFSIDADGVMLPTVQDGKKGFIVQDILSVNSVDIVTDPAAGGRLLRMVASLKKRKGETKMFEQLIKLLREDPSILGIKESKEVEEFKAKSDKDVLGMLFESMSKAKESNPDPEKDPEADPEADPEKDPAKDPEADPESDPAPDPEADPIKEANISDDGLKKIVKMLDDKNIKEAKALLSSLINSGGKPKKKKAAESNVPDEKLTAKMDEVDKLIESIKIKESQTTLSNRLNDSTLPDIIKDKIKKSFVGKMVESKVIDDVIKDEREILSKLKESGVVDMGDIGMGRTKGDKMQFALDMMLGFKPTTDEQKTEYKDVVPFRSLKESYIAWTGDVHLEGKPNQRMTEAVTSDFPDALGTSMNRRMTMEYNMIDLVNSVKQFIEIVSVDNFKTQDIIRIGGLEDLPIVAEDGSYTYAATPSEEKANYAIAKRGYLFNFTREMIINDDLKALRQWPAKMGRAAARTWVKFVMDLLLNYGAGAINGGTIYDGAALYTATKTNFTALDLDYDPLNDAITAMANQVEADSSQPIGIRAKHLIVATEQRAAAKILVDSEKRPAATGTPGSVESVNPNYKAVEPLVFPKGYLRNDANNWYLVGDKNDAETIEIGFLNGREQPEIFIQDGNTVGEVFTRDRITYKIRHEYSGATVDYRPFYAGIVAGLS